MRWMKRLLTLLALLGAAAAVVYFGLWENNWLQVTHYAMESERIQQTVRIVQLTDLHNHEFGEKNEKLLELIRREKPDLIVITGDCLNASEKRTDIMLSLFEKCTEIAPTYVSYGNHEIEYMENFTGKEQLQDEILKTGVRLLDRSWEDVEIGGNKLRIGGIYGYVLSPEVKKETYMKDDDSEVQFMEAFGDTGRFRLLLSHRPEGLLLWDSMEYFDVDLIFSGHLHGGQIRLPVIGGLYSPEEGWFPSITDGYFEKGGSVMALSRGLGNTESVPRWNNRPQVISLQLKAAVK
ncbi:MAG: metallophosphoesterase [Lachnospiraceae bacterium]|nr:metallophosphoesterase [Lachnospiraceae bacterium]